MSARAKLEEANFFLEKLRALQTLPQDLDKQRESRYFLNAFLSVARSVIDHLLEDYNIKFSLNIPLTKRMYPNTSKRRQKKLITTVLCYSSNGGAKLVFKFNKIGVA